jgi:choline kinase
MNSKLHLNKIVGIILAAGRGSRLGKITKAIPKSFLKINNKKLIEKIIESFQISNVKKIKIITGYRSDKFNIFKDKNINIIKNKNWKTTNILGSLFFADKFLSKYPCIISYADVYYDAHLIEIMANDMSSNCIILPSYNNWRIYWKKRFKNPLVDLEKFKISKGKRLLEIGENAKFLKEIQGQYMGLFKISPKIWKKIKIQILKNKKNFMKMDITSLLNLILKKKLCDIKIINYKNQWFEIDNHKDYLLLKKEIKKYKN